MTDGEGTKDNDGGTTDGTRVGAEGLVTKEGNGVKVMNQERGGLMLCCHITLGAKDEGCRI